MPVWVNGAKVVQCGQCKFCWLNAQNMLRVHCEGLLEGVSVRTCMQELGGRFDSIHNEDTFVQNSTCSQAAHVRRDGATAAHAGDG